MSHVLANRTSVLKQSQLPYFEKILQASYCLLEYLIRYDQTIEFQSTISHIHDVNYIDLYKSSCVFTQQTHKDMKIASGCLLRHSNEQ